MKTIPLGATTWQVPRVVVGCMRINTLDRQQAEGFVRGALELGANFFDHADIYGGGECERVFAQAVGMRPSVRGQMILQSKCGIRPDLHTFDFSREHIIASVDGILSRLRSEYLDILLLHRPDALMQPDEVAKAFERLHTSGKVRYFGVSNQNPGQLRLLQKHLGYPVVANQLQLSITNCTMISNGINVNMTNDSAVCRDDSVLDYCRLHDITIQAWSPFQYGTFEGVFLGSDKFPELNAKIQDIAAKYGVSDTTVAAAWILRHPAGMQVISGTTKLSRLKEICLAAEIDLSREDWYAIYRAAGNDLP